MLNVDLNWQLQAHYYKYRESPLGKCSYYVPDGFYFVEYAYNIISLLYTWLKYTPVTMRIVSWHFVVLCYVMICYRHHFILILLGCFTGIWSNLGACGCTCHINPPRYDDIHYTDVIMGTIASQITSLTIVYSTVYSVADQRKYQSPASLAFVRGIHRRPVSSTHRWPVTRKMFPFGDVIM